MTIMTTVIKIELEQIFSDAKILAEESTKRLILNTNLRKRKVLSLFFEIFDI